MASDVSRSSICMDVLLHFSGFVNVPSPPIMIVAMEERHVFMCNHSATDRISWRVNGRVVGVDSFFLNVTTDIILLSDGGTASTLTIGGLSEHNETTVQCTAMFADSRSIPVVSPSVTFLMQGLYLCVL